MGKHAAKITDSEFTIMRVLWDAGDALPVSDIRKALERSSSWDSSTIKTLLRRLCDKGVVSAEKKEVYYYKPLVSEETYNESATQSLIDRLYAGSAKNLVASLIDGNKLTEKELAELRTILEEGEPDA